MKLFSFLKTGNCFSLLISCFFLSCDSAITKNILQSLFITKFGTKHLPIIWLFFLPLSIIGTWLYSKSLKKWTPNQIFSCLLLVVSSVNLVLGSLLPITRFSLMALYLWRELYPLFLFQSLWGIFYGKIKKENNTNSMRGAMFSIGAMGLVVGSLVSNLLASLNHHHIFFLLSYLILIFLKQLDQGKLALNKKSVCSKEEKNEEGSLLQVSGILWMASTIFFLQIFSCLQEFLLYHAIENHISEPAIRIKCFSKITCVIGMFSIFGPYLISYLCCKLDYRYLNIFFFIILTCALWLKKFIGKLEGEIVVFCLSRIFDSSCFIPNREVFYSTLNKRQLLHVPSFLNIAFYRGSKALLGLILFLSRSYFGKNTILFFSDRFSCLSLLFLLVSHFLWARNFRNTEKKSLTLEEPLKKEDSFL